MRRAIIFLLMIIASVNSFSQHISVVKLTCDNRENPAGIENRAPSFGWQLKSDQKAVMQTAYRILVSDDPALLQNDSGNIWDSKKIMSAQSIQVKYRGKKLLSSKTYFWKVIAWDNKKNVSQWSSVSEWQMGLFNSQDWKNARWIAYEELEDSLKTIPSEHGKGSAKGLQLKSTLPLLRKKFEVTKQIKKQRFSFPAWVILK